MKDLTASEKSLLSRIEPSRVPAHIAIIMDGNGRWAERQGEHRLVGHSNGVTSVREALTGATHAGVKYLTLYAFSTENWNRPQEEVNALMDLLVKTLLTEVESLHENGVKLNAIGDLGSLPESCLTTLRKAIDLTKDNSQITLTLALSYSARWEIQEMVRALMVKAAAGKIGPDEVGPEVIAAHLSTHGIPDPELLIRTSGELRISNFLLWQIAYTELYFTELLWPEFRKKHLFEAIIEYQHRERRFGKVSEQLGTGEGS